MYAHRKADEGREGASSLTLLTNIPSGPRPRCEKPITAESLLSLTSAKVVEGDDVFRYAHRVLASLLPAQPNFPERIRFLHEREDRPVRILSLCSGAAGIEWRMIADAGCPVAITLFDLNETLMRKAEGTLSSVAHRFQSVSAVTRLLVRSILRFPRQTLAPTVSKGFGVRRSNRYCCATSTPWRFGGETVFCGAWLIRFTSLTTT